MGTKNNSAKPWLDHRGRELPTEQLREISKNWDLKTWKRYADSLEVQPEGKSLKPGELRRLQAEQTKSIFDINCETPANPNLVLKMNQALDLLSERQRQVVDLIFYQGKSIQETALELCLSKPMVHKYKMQSLAKLKGVLSVNVNAVAVYEGVSDLETESKTPFEELLDVMNEDISRDDSAKHDFDKGDRE